MSNRNWIVVGMAAALLCIPSTFAFAAADTQPADGSGAPPVTLITLHMKDASPADVLAEIARQADVKLDPSPSNLFMGNYPNVPPSMSLDLDETLFWPAMAQFCSATHTIASPTAGRTSVVTVSQARDTSGRLGGVMRESGMFCFVAMTIQHSATVFLGDSRTIQNDEIRMNIYCDPKIVTVACAWPILETASDENGNSLLPPPDPADTHDPSAMTPTFGGAIPDDLHIRLPPGRGRKLADLKGTIKIAAATRFDTLTIDNARDSVGKNFKLDGRTMRVDAFDSPDTPFPLQITVSRPDEPNSGFSLPLFDDPFHRVHIYDADGADIAAFANGQGPPSQMQLSYRFFRPGSLKEPIKAVWIFPVEAKVFTVPFEFKDLPLPEP